MLRAAAAAVPSRGGGSTAPTPRHRLHRPGGQASHTHTHHVGCVLDLAALRTARVVGQLDRKFIVLNTAPAAKSSQGTSPASIVLLDQHAVHERIRYESLSAHLHSCIQGRLARLQTAPLAQGDTTPHKPPPALKAHEKLIPHTPALPPSQKGTVPTCRTCAGACSCCSLCSWSRPCTPLRGASQHCCKPWAS